MSKWTRPPGYQADGDSPETVSVDYMDQLAAIADRLERRSHRARDKGYTSMQARIRREHIARILADVRRLRIAEQTKK